MTAQPDKRTVGESSAAENASPMSFWEHLDVLRWALLRVVVVFVVVFAVVVALLPRFFSPFVLGPTRDDFFVYRWLQRLSHGVAALDGGFCVEIINIHVASQFMTHLNISLLLSLVVVAPYILYEVWRYVRPALYSRERRAVRLVFAGGAVMFFLGCVVGYALVFPLTFRFLAGYELSADITNTINLQSYVGMFTNVLFVMGVVFEMPLVVWLLGSAGLLRRTVLRRYRRHAIVVLLILAAVITPSGDPFTLLVVFLPLYLLYELSIAVCPSDRR